MSQFWTLSMAEIGNSFEHSPRLRLELILSTVHDWDWNQFWSLCVTEIGTSFEHCLWLRCPSKTSFHFLADQRYDNHVVIDSECIVGAPLLSIKYLQTCTAWSLMWAYVILLHQNQNRIKGLPARLYCSLWGFYCLSTNIPLNATIIEKKIYIYRHCVLFSFDVSFYIFFLNK